MEEESVKLLWDTPQKTFSQNRKEVGKKRGEPFFKIFILILNNEYIM